MPLSSEEIERYARHIVLRGVGGAGQQRLAQASLLVIGAGGLGAPVLAYCAAAGIGRIGIVDHDDLALPDLQRQVLYTTAVVGAPKATAAAAAVRALNPHVAVESFVQRFTDGIAYLPAAYDIVADCTDDASARYVISDACFHARRPLVSATVGRFDGSLTVLKPHESAADGTPNPTYRCLFPKPPADGAVATCAEVGVLGPVAGIVGAMQATAIVNELLGIGSGLVGRLVLVDGRELRTESIAYRWDPANPLNGRSAG